MTLRVLLVENERPVARAVERLLRRAGYCPTVARNCTEANALRECFDLGIFDIDLGDGHGVDLAEQCLAKGSVRAAAFYTGADYENKIQSDASHACIQAPCQTGTMLGAVGRSRSVMSTLMVAMWFRRNDWVW